MYDYNLGRFYSVDPVIQAPGDSQSLNPYSYIMNNPLAGTDPTGYTAECEVKEKCQDPPKRAERSGRSFVQGVIHQRQENGVVRNTAFDTPNAVANNPEANAIGEQRKITNNLIGVNKFGNVKSLKNLLPKKQDYLTFDVDNAQERGIPFYDTNDPNYHEYVYDRAICTSSLNSNCNVSNVQYGSRLYPVPLSKGNLAVTTGDVSNAQIGLVRHVVDNETNTVVNITLPGKHMLDPGKVVRTVYQKGSVVFIRTYGDGVGNYGGLNSSLVNVDLVWGGVNRDITRYIRLI